MSGAPTPVIVRWTALDRPAIATLGSALLDDGERRRAGSLRAEEVRRTFVVSRTMLRSVVGALTGTDPAALRFGVGDRGRPRLVGPAGAKLDFNLSHSHGLVAVAAAATGPLGLDLERLREVAAAERLARRFFAPDELAAVLDREGADRDRAFLAIWTAKEAWLKATGRGISVPLASVEVEPDPDRPPRLVALPDDDPARWSQARVPLPLDAVCTLTVAGPLGALEVREWRP